MLLKWELMPILKCFPFLSDEKVLKYWKSQTKVQDQKYIKMADLASLRVSTCCTFIPERTIAIVVQHVLYLSMVCIFENTSKDIDHYYIPKTNIIALIHHRHQRRQFSRCMNYNYISCISYCLCYVCYFLSFCIRKTHY